MVRPHSPTEPDGAKAHGRAFVAIPPDVLDGVISAADGRRQATGQPWERHEIVILLARCQDLAARPGRPQRFPSRRQLVARTGWSERRIRDLLADTDAWMDPRKTEPRPSRVPVASQSRPNRVPNQTGEPDVSVDLRPNRVPIASQSRPNHVHTRVSSTTTTTTTTTERKHRRASANVPPEVAEVWREYVETSGRQTRAEGPPRGWGMAQRIAEHGAEDARLVIAWAFRSPDTWQGRETRAAYLRAQGHTGETLWRPGKFGEYLELARRWDAAGRPSSDSRGATTTTAAPADPAEAAWSRWLDLPGVRQGSHAVYPRRPGAGSGGFALSPDDAEHARMFSAMREAGGWAGGGGWCDLPRTSTAGWDQRAVAEWRGRWIEAYRAAARKENAA